MEDTDPVAPVAPVAPAWPEPMRWNLPVLELYASSVNTPWKRSPGLSAAPL
jgi:hypothetical protein